MSRLCCGWSRPMFAFHLQTFVEVLFLPWGSLLLLAAFRFAICVINWNFSPTSFAHYFYRDFDLASFLLCCWYTHCNIFIVRLDATVPPRTSCVKSTFVQFLASFNHSNSTGGRGLPLATTTSVLMRPIILHHGGSTRTNYSACRFMRSSHWKQ